MVIEPSAWNDVKAVFDKWELDAAVIGETTPGKNLTICMKGECYADLPAEILSKKAPRYVRETKAVPVKTGAEKLTQVETALQKGDTSGLTHLFSKLLSHPNLCSRQPIYRQYDTDIGLKRVIGPGQNGCVVRVPDSKSALAMTIDGNGYYIAVDPYKGAQLTVAEAVRNIAATGAIPIGLTNCLNFANPYIPENYWFFKEAVTGMSDACRAFKVPIISGNVSFYNESEDGPVLPTPTMGVVGLLADAEHAVPGAPASLSEPLSLYLAGAFKPTQAASQYHYVEGLSSVGPLPELDMACEIAGAAAMAQLAEQGALAAAIDLSAGGLLRALCRMAFAAYEASGKMPGIEVTELTKLVALAGSVDTALLGETAHTYLLAVEEKNSAKLTAAATDKFPILRIGALAPAGATLKLGGLSLQFEDLYQAWSTGLAEYFR